MRFLDWLRSQPARRARQVRRQAGLRRRPRVLGSSGLPAEAELWVMQIEDALRRMEPRIRGDLSGLSCLPALAAASRQPGPLPGSDADGDLSGLSRLPALARGEPPARPATRQATRTAPGPGKRSRTATGSPASLRWAEPSTVTAESWARPMTAPQKGNATGWTTTWPGWATSWPVAACATERQTGSG